mmetsp:Transcript_24386/g.54946  ORF Transcript_24386/g.54946 Transcript_24386/m.54946 type:complete len:209 (-) Transcript_24386:89-715(-)
MSNTTTISDPAPSTPKTIRVLEGEILYKQKSFSSSPTSCCPATCGCMDSEEQCLVLPTVNGELGTSQSELPREDCDLWKRFDYNCKLDSSGKKLKNEQNDQERTTGSSPAKVSNHDDEENAGMLPPPQGVFQRTRSSGSCFSRSSSRFGRLPSTPQQQTAPSSAMFARTQSSCEGGSDKSRAAYNRQIGVELEEEEQRQLEFGRCSSA